MRDSVLGPYTRAPRRPLPGALTRREREIALLVAEDLKNFSIARRLALSPATVATYIQRIQARLGLEDRREIKAWVQARGHAIQRDDLSRSASADKANKRGGIDSPAGCL